jgi:hypothetical protein
VVGYRTAAGDQVLGACFSALILLACSPGNENAPGCSDSTSHGEPVAGALEIGIGGPSDFRALFAGEMQELVLGSQGGYMVTPVFRVDAAALGTDGTCAFIEVTHTVESMPPAHFHFMLPSFDASEPYWYIGSLPLFLSRETTSLVGKSCTLSALFQDGGVATSAEAHTLLVDQN